MDVLPLLCPACGAEMKILAFLTDPPVVSAILLHLDLPHKPPPISPAREPPQSDLLVELLDQSPAFDPAEPDPVPEFDFDQSVPDDFDLSLSRGLSAVGFHLPPPSLPILASRRLIPTSLPPPLFNRPRFAWRARTASARYPRSPPPLPRPATAAPLDLLPAAGIPGREGDLLQRVNAVTLILTAGFALYAMVQYYIFPWIMPRG